MDLFKKDCREQSEKNSKPFSKAKAKEFAAEVPGWELNRDAKKISKEFTFKNFVRAISFVRRVAQVAEIECHHPDIHISYDTVVFDLSTHSIKGLSENDFIVAAKIDKLKKMEL